MHALVAHNHLHGDPEFHRVNRQTDRSRFRDPNVLPGRHRDGIRSRRASKRTGRRDWIAALITPDGRAGVGDAAQSTAGVDLRGADARRTGNSGVRQSAKRPERRDAARHLHSHAHNDGERPNANITQFPDPGRPVGAAVWRCRRPGVGGLARRVSPGPAARAKICVRYSNLKPGLQNLLYSSIPSLDLQSGPRLVRLNV
jgi:hypothetical protein